MSSTKRGSKRSPADNYPSPPWPFLRFFERYPRYAHNTKHIKRERWVEPCVGDGAIIRAAKDHFGENSPHWTAVELRPECEKLVPEADRLYCPQDFLTWEPEERFDVAITNPPFWLAEQVLEKCLKIADRVILLLRLNFLGSEKRQPTLAVRMPNEVGVLPNRPPFCLTSKGLPGTDSIEYAIFVWESANPVSVAQTYVLGLTPKSERRRTFGRLADLANEQRIAEGKPPRRRQKRKADEGEPSKS